MAVTPSEDYKRREREQRKLENVSLARPRKPEKLRPIRSPKRLQPRRLLRRARQRFRPNLRRNSRQNSRPSASPKGAGDCQEFSFSVRAPISDGIISTIPRPPYKTRPVLYAISALSYSVLLILPSFDYREDSNYKSD